MNLRKAVLLAAVLAGIVAFFAFDLDRFFSLAFIQDSQQQFAALGERDTLPVQVTQGAAARGIVVVSILVQRREEAGRLRCAGSSCKEGDGECPRAGHRVGAYQP